MNLDNPDRFFSMIFRGEGVKPEEDVIAANDTRRIRSLRVYAQDDTTENHERHRSTEAQRFRRLDPA